MSNDQLADVLEAITDMTHWKPLYEKLLQICQTKKEAREALLYTMNIAMAIESKKRGIN